MPGPERVISDESRNAKISPTAWGVAYLRTFSDIPYCKEIFEALESRRQAAGEDFSEQKMKAPLAPQLEARYKLVDRLLENAGISQILEVGSGLAPRGLNWTKNNPDTHYVDTDLPDMTRDKIGILSAIDAALPENLMMVAADALSWDDLESAAALLSPDKPAAIVNEGLMRYLNFEQKTQYAKSVRALLERFGGVWITPDISLRSAMERKDEVAPGHIKKLETKTSVDLSQNVFESVEHAEKFFNELGFKVEKHSFLEVSDELVSPAKLGMSAGQVERLNGPCPAFVMRLV